MAYPPPDFATDKDNSSVMANNHPVDHNGYAQALNDIKAKIGNLPGAGGYPSIDARFTAYSRSASVIIAHTTSPVSWIEVANYIVTGSSNVDTTAVNAILATVGLGGAGAGGHVIFAPPTAGFYDFGPTNPLAIPANVTVEFMDSEGKLSSVSGLGSYGNIVAQFEGGVTFGDKSTLMLGAGTFGVGSSSNATAKMAVSGGSTGASLLGRGDGSTIVIRHSSVTSANGILDCTGTSSTAKNSFFLVRDIHFHGNQGGVNQTYPLVNLNHVSYFQFQNVTFEEAAGAGIYINDCDNSVLMNCKFFNCGTVNGSPVRASIHIYTDGTNKCHDLYFMNTSIDNPSDTGIWIVGSSTVTHNRIHFNNMRLEDHETGNNPTIKIDYLGGGSFRDIALIIGENFPNTAVVATDQVYVTNSRNLLFDNIYFEATNSALTGGRFITGAFTAPTYKVVNVSDGNAWTPMNSPATSTQYVGWTLVWTGGNAVGQIGVVTGETVGANNGLTFATSFSPAPNSVAGSTFVLACQNILSWINLAGGNNYITIENVQAVAQAYHYAYSIVSFAGTDNNYIKLDNGGYITDNSGQSGGACIRRTNPTPTTGKRGIISNRGYRTIVSTYSVDPSPIESIFGADYVCPPGGTRAAPESESVQPTVRSVIQQAFEDSLVLNGNTKLPLKFVQGTFNVTTSGPLSGTRPQKDSCISLNFANATTWGDLLVFGDGRGRSNLLCLIDLPVETSLRNRYFINVFNTSQGNGLVLKDLTVNGMVTSVSLQNPITKVKGNGLKLVSRSAYEGIEVNNFHSGLVLDGLDSIGQSTYTGSTITAIGSSVGIATTAPTAPAGFSGGTFPNYLGFPQIGNAVITTSDPTKVVMFSYISNLSGGSFSSVISATWAAATSLPNASLVGVYNPVDGTQYATGTSFSIPNGATIYSRLDWVDNTDHCRMYDIPIGGCKHGFRTTNNSGINDGVTGATGAIDNLFWDIRPGGNQVSGFCVSDTGRVVGSTFIDCHSANNSYGFYKEGIFGVSPTVPIVFQDCNFIRTKCEGSGNWAFYDESGLSRWDACFGSVHIHAIRPNQSVIGGAVNLNTTKSYQPVTGTATFAAGSTTITTTNHGVAQLAFTGTLTAGNTSITGVSPTPAALVAGSPVYAIGIQKDAFGNKEPGGGTALFENGVPITVTSVSGTTINLSGTIATNATAFLVGGVVVDANGNFVARGIKPGDIVSMCPQNGGSTAAEKDLVDSALVTAVTENTIVVTQTHTPTHSPSAIAVQLGTCGGINLGSMTGGNISFNFDDDKTTIGIGAASFFEFDKISGNVWTFELQYLPYVNMRGLGNTPFSGGFTGKDMNTVGIVGTVKCLLLPVSSGSCNVGDLLEITGQRGVKKATATLTNPYAGVARTPGNITPTIVSGVSMGRPYIWVQTEGPFFSADTPTSPADTNAGVPYVGTAPSANTYLKRSSGTGGTVESATNTAGEFVVATANANGSGGFIAVTLIPAFMW